MSTNQLISLATNNLGLLATSIAIVLSALFLLRSRSSPELRSLPSFSYVESWRTFFTLFILPKRWIKGDPLLFLVDLYRQPKFRPLCVMGTNVVLVNDYDAIKEVLAKGMNSYNGRNKTERSAKFIEDSTRAFKEEHIGNTKDDSWKWRRHLMAPLFHPRKVVPSLLPFVIRRVNKLIATIAAAQGEPIEVDELIIELTLDVICWYIFGQSSEELDKSALDGSSIGHHFAGVVTGFRSARHTIPLIGNTAWADVPRKSRNALLRFLNKAIDDSLAKYAAVNHDNEDEAAFRPLVVELAKSPEYKNGERGKELLTADIMALVFAGHDTTSHTAAFGMAEFSMHPECQAEVVREVHEILGDAPFADPSNVTPSRLAGLSYVSNCIHEALRMYPAAVLIPADAKVDMELCGTVIPKGTRFICNLRGYSYDPTIFPQPETFNPQRWSHLTPGSDDAMGTEDMPQGHMHPDLGFSLGAHACLGRSLAILELRCLFTMVLERFHVSPKEGYEIETELLFTLRPKNGVWLQFKERK